MFVHDLWDTVKIALHGIRHIWRYLRTQQWHERVQSSCVFCRHKSLNPIYEDDTVIAFEDIRPAGLHHWLITPKVHIRDIENLSSSHLPLLIHFDEVKHQLLKRHLPTDIPSTTISGYHRGRRPMVRDTFWPDIVSVHHLHLHVIVEPRLLLRLFKYPSWLPLMWKTDRQVLREVEVLSRKQP